MYDDIRGMPLVAVLGALGFGDEWKERKNGTEWYGKCPIHGAKRNATSFSFHVDGRFRCFSCPAKGRGAIDLVMQIRKVNFKDAVSELEALRGAIERQPDEKPSDTQTPPITQNPAFEGRYQKFYVDSPWLTDRGFTKDTLERFGVGQYENPKRRSIYAGKVMLPILRFEDGVKVGYLARDIRQSEERGADPKYIFPKGFAKHLELFGAWQIKNEVPAQLPLRLVCLVESPFSVLKFAQCGVPAVSPFGWSVSPEQAAILARLAKGCIYLPDADKRDEARPYAGLLAQLMWVKCPALADDVRDPEQLSPDQIRLLMT